MSSQQVSRRKYPVLDFSTLCVIDVDLYRILCRARMKELRGIRQRQMELKSENCERTTYTRWHVVVRLKIYMFFTN